MSTDNQRTNWVDFKALKQNVSFLTILEHYSLLNALQRKGEKLVGSCPIHKGDSSTAFHVDLKKNVYKCFTRCKSKGLKGGGNIIDFVADMEKLGQQKEGVKKAAQLIVEWTGGQPASERPAGNSNMNKEKNIKENKPLTFQLKLSAEHPYFIERGLTQETVEFFGLGYANKGIMKDRICIPIHDHKGNLVAYAGRALDDELAKKEGKYKLPANFHKSLVLFNFNRIEEFDALILVEGFFDCFKVYQSGFKSVCALMGASMSEFQEKLILERFKRIVLMLDSDSAGRQGAKDVLNRLYDKIYVRVVKLEEKKQPDELSENEIQKLLAFL